MSTTSLERCDVTSVAFFSRLAAAQVMWQKGHRWSSGGPTEEKHDNEPADTMVIVMRAIALGSAGWVAENGKAIVNGNPSVEPGYLQDPTRFSTLRSALSVPLPGIDGTMGMVTLYHSGAVERGRETPSSSVGQCGSRHYALRRSLGRQRLRFPPFDPIREVGVRTDMPSVRSTDEAGPRIISRNATYRQRCCTLVPHVCQADLWLELMP